MEKDVRVILDGLNDEQKKAVQAVDGPVLIIAGAGSGKTRVLTGRVAYILALGCDPSRVLALTFTKKAAQEMKERIGMMVGAANARRVVMGTFHSVFVRFLRKYADRLGYPDQFTIYDQSDSQSAVKACVKELQLDDKIYKPKEVLSRISMAKNNLITVSAYRSRRELLDADLHSKKPRIADIYALYQKKLKDSGVMDFDDILLNMNILLRDCPEALAEISSRFSHIMVDEYQDTNYSQYLIIKKLSQPHRNICVVGDDSQSIYAFRGAKIENILNFRKDYPDSRMFRLERNYRSTANIVNAANSVIAHNEGRIPKNCYSEAEEGEKIRLLKCYNENDEAANVAGEILGRLHSEHASYRDFAILYRTNSQSRALEEMLRRRNLPYMVYSGNSFYDRAEVKDMMAYFKLVVNPNDDESFKRIVNKPARGIGDTSLSALNEFARSLGCSLFKAAFSPGADAFGLKPTAQQKILAFVKMIDSLASAMLSTGALEMAQKIADDSGLYAFYKSDTSIEGLSRTANVEELVNSVASFEADRENEQEELDEPVGANLADFLENVSLLSNADVDDEDSDNKIALMTVHSAKGLEFPYVFITGMEENLFPSLSMMASPRDVEEERRLFYVALTRAKKAAYFAFCESRMRNGKTEYNAPSRFVREVDPKYIENPLEEEDFAASRESWHNPLSGGFGRAASGSAASSPFRKQVFFGTKVRQDGSSAPNSVHSVNPSPKPAVSAPKPAPIAGFAPSSISSIVPGIRVEHISFGGGLVKEVAGERDMRKAVIDFDNFGEKTILLKYLKLRLEQ